ncbi:MAG: hypothetical protein IJW58_03295 [Clostridia bacterium]|nr:hypothetical protein [Clostridia bacterium]
MKFEFIADLDEYFCENYANYDKICILPGYRMPKMQATERLENGRDRTYTLPASTMRLAKQEKKTELLTLLKSKMADKSFSFSFVPAGFRDSLFRFSKLSFAKTLSSVLAKYALTVEDAKKELSIDEKIWKRICSGSYLPTKNLIISLALTARFSYEDTQHLFAVCGMEFDYTLERDVVFSYLLKQKVYNQEMIKASFEEYNVSNLFIAWL